MPRERCRVTRLGRLFAVSVFALAGHASALQCHHEGHATRAVNVADTAMFRWDAMGMAIPLVTRATPTAGRTSLTEGYLTQPMLMSELRAFRGRLAAVGTLNIEGATLRRGELTTSTWGEGFVDRRHPHAWVHEAVLSAKGQAFRGDWSLSAGRGFVPFGTDDPMMRPFVKYPANHHLAQILERLVLIGAVRVGPLLAEGALFNGDEPVGPGSPPTVSRFADSWSARVIAMPRPEIELAASVARVESPENPDGIGLDQRKVAASARWMGASRLGIVYGLAEWARTEDWRPGRRAFTYETWLAEGSLCGRRGCAALRLEQTERPEEERSFDLFHVPHPHADFNVLGITRFRTATVAVTAASVVGLGIRMTPFVEAAVAVPHAVGGGVFDPERFYGSRRLAMLSAGVRLHAGQWHRRMGRYGVAAQSTHPTLRLGAHTAPH